MQNGSVFAWGDNRYGELGNGTTTQSLTPIMIDAVNLTNIVAVAAGYSSSYALSSDGSLWVWGANGDGQLGLGTNTYDSLTPQHLLPPSGYIYTAIDVDADSTAPVAILTAVPEPSTWAAAAIGAGVLGAILRRRQGRTMTSSTEKPTAAAAGHASGQPWINNFLLINRACRRST